MWPFTKYTVRIRDAYVYLHEPTRQDPAALVLVAGKAEAGGIRGIDRDSLLETLIPWHRIAKVQWA